MANPVVHFEVIGKDAAKLRDFYARAFDWNIQGPIPGSPADYALVPRIDAKTAGGIGGGIGSCPEGSPGHVTFYVYTDDMEATLDKIESLGGKRAMEPEHVPGGPTIAMFEDPEGHLIGLVHGQT